MGYLEWVLGDPLIFLETPYKINFRPSPFSSLLAIIALKYHFWPILAIFRIPKISKFTKMAKNDIYKQLWPKVKKMD